MIGLDHKYLVTVSDFLDQAPNRSALCLETSGVRNVELQVSNADVGFSTQYLCRRAVVESDCQRRDHSSGAISTILKASMMSPSLMS